MMITHCPVCHVQELVGVVVVHNVPVYCNVHWASEEQARVAPRGDIDLVFCSNCGHLFNRAFDPALVDYDQGYENSLHYSPRFQQYAEKQAEDLCQRHELDGKSIMEIGSGQGDFLRLLCRDGRNKGVGFDPSYRPQEGDDTPYLQFVQAYYDETYAYQDADFVCCRHVLEHVPRPDEFVGMVRRAAARESGTVVFFEVPNVMYTLRDLGVWDLIYEHFSYFSEPSLKRLFTSNRFAVEAVRETFGGQFLTIEAYAIDNGEPVLVGAKRQFLLDAVGAFADRYEQKVGWWREKLHELRDMGQRAVVWGSGSKGVTFLNVLETSGQIAHVVDINPRKQGMFVAGTGQQIVGPHFLQTEPPDIVIIMNPNYEEEIRRTLQQLELDSTVLLA